jgi:hypothetical protein
MCIYSLKFSVAWCWTMCDVTYVAESVGGCTRRTETLKLDFRHPNERHHRSWFIYPSRTVKKWLKCFKFTTVKGFMRWRNDNGRLLPTNCAYGNAAQNLEIGYNWFVWNSSSRNRLTLSNLCLIQCRRISYQRKICHHTGTHGTFDYYLWFKRRCGRVLVAGVTAVQLTKTSQPRHMPKGNSRDRCATCCHAKLPKCKVKCNV